MTLFQMICNPLVNFMFDTSPKGVTTSDLLSCKILQFGDETCITFSYLIMYCFDRNIYLWSLDVFFLIQTNNNALGGYSVKLIMVGEVRL